MSPEDLPGPIVGIWPTPSRVCRSDSPCRGSERPTQSLRAKATRSTELHCEKPMLGCVTVDGQSKPLSDDITRLLRKLNKGNREAEAKLIPLIYEQLRRLARGYLRRERTDHTLQTAALVHEAYLKILVQRSTS